MKFWPFLLIFISAAISTVTANAWISEESDNLLSSQCQGAFFEVETDGANAKGSFADAAGRRLHFTGSILKVTIDTEDSSVNMLVLLKDLESAGLRYLNVKVIGGKAKADLHRNISTVAGDLGTGTCSLNFK